ncbi:DNA helicase [Malassezia sp. CBS 17886]|nr:DNA helicase [Malassezia sp. CBS 17886]
MFATLDDDAEVAPQPMAEPSASALRSENPDRELSPEPDYDLNTARGSHQVWLVKVPKFLIDGWSHVRRDDVRLGTVRVYDPDHTGEQRMELLLPEAPQPAIPLDDPLARTQYSKIPREYDMRLTSSTQDTYAKNLYAFAEELVDDDDNGSELGDDDALLDEVNAVPTARRRAPGTGPARTQKRKKRLTALTGSVSNETALQPKKIYTANATDSKAKVHGSRSLVTPEYREILRHRRLQTSSPRRSVKLMDEADAGVNNMLAAGVGKGHIKSRAANLVMQATQARTKQAPEKFARMPRNELLDLLFQLFDRYKHWSLKRLREETQQPYVYLREVLLSIADQHHNGPYAGSWSLKREYSEAQRNAAAAQSTENASAAGPSSKPDGGDMDDVV